MFVNVVRKDTDSNHSLAPDFLCKCFIHTLNEAVVLYDLKGLSSPGYLLLIEVGFQKTNAAATKVTENRCYLIYLISKQILYKL